MNDEYIAHHGIKNQRWGVKHGPPYPVRRGAGGKPKTTSIVKSRLKAALDNRAETLAKKKQDSQKRYEAAKEKRANKAAEKAVDEHEKLKKQIVARPKDIYKYRDQFSKSELEQLIKDIEFDRKIKDVKIAEVKRGLDSLNRVRDATQSTSQLLTSAKDIYNLVADVNNAFIDSGKSNGKKWTKVGGGGDKKPEAGDTKPDNKKPKVNTRVSMSSPSVASQSPAQKKAADAAVKKYGSFSMKNIDDAFRYINSNGPMSFYGNDWFS